MNWMQALNTTKLPPLVRGHHPDGPEHGMCAMEMISFMECQPFSDKPKGVCEILRGFTIAINDLLDDESRQKLMPVLPELVETSVDPQRTHMRQRFIEDRVMRTWDHYYGRRESYYDYERDRMRYRSYPDHRGRDRAYHFMSKGPGGWVRLMLEILPPWHAADVLIAMLREAITVGQDHKHTEFGKPEQVEKLAKVIYLPEHKRKSGQDAAAEYVAKNMKEHVNFAVLHGHSLIKGKDAMISYDMAV